MIEKIKKMTGMKRVIFETLCAMICVSGVYIITFLFTGSVEVSAFVAAVAAAFATLAAAAGATAAAFAFVAAFATLAAATAATAIIAFAFAAATAAVVVAVVAVVIVVATAATTAVAAIVVAVVVDEYRVRYRNVLFLYLIEIALLVASFLFFTPYLAIVLLFCYAVVASAIYFHNPIVKKDC